MRHIKAYDPKEGKVGCVFMNIFSFCLAAPNMLISRLATQQRLSAGSEWTHGVHQESHSKLEYEYRMVCSRHYFGGDCDTLCRPRDDQFGHYTCDSDGEKVCLNGWQKDTTRPEGDYCTKGTCRVSDLG